MSRRDIFDTLGKAFLEEKSRLSFAHRIDFSAEEVWTASLYWQLLYTGEKTTTVRTTNTFSMVCFQCIRAWLLLYVV